MAKADAVKTDTPVVEITLTEFCTSLSKTDKRVEQSRPPEGRGVQLPRPLHGLHQQARLRN